MVKKKKCMAYLATVLLLVVSMIMTACGGPGRYEKGCGTIWQAN